MHKNNVELQTYYSQELIRELSFIKDTNQKELNTFQEQVLFECERYGAIQQQRLVSILHVDKSYVCKLVNSLVNLGFVCFDELEKNKKSKPIHLTDLGLMKVKELHEQLNLNAQSTIKFITETEQNQIIEGLRLYSRALRKARNLEGIDIRPITPEDNNQVTVLIKTVLSEFGANRPGFAYMDEETNSMYEFYQKEGSAYFVAQKENKIIGGIGYSSLQGSTPNVCELRKMYLSKEVRGLGLGNELLRIVIEEAKNHYTEMYLETLSHMTQAISLYRKFEFEFLKQPMGATGHYSCDTWMYKLLS